MDLSLVHSQTMWGPLGGGSRFPACCIKLHLHSEGVGETAWMCRLIRTFAVRLEDKYSEHIDCLINKTFEGQLFHLVVHAREKRYTCDICRQSFHFTNESTVVSDLTRFKHVVNHLLGVVVYGSTCLQVHQPEKLHMCQLCNNVFWVEGNLKKHMLKHAGDNTPDM